MEKQGQLEPKLNTEHYRWLRQQLRTDLLNLDDEMSKIATLVQDAAEYAAIAYEIRDTAKEELSVATAKACERLRREPLASGKTRSEMQIESEYPLCPEHTEAVGNLSEARLDAALWGSMADGYRTKASSLYSAGELIKSGYITQNYLIDKRRKEIREAEPRSVEK